MNKTIEKIVASNIYGMIGELDINNMTETLYISKNENSNELLIKLK